jgi:23S rRNA (uridine2552-2'-O)-methyltransferase
MAHPGIKDFYRVKAKQEGFPARSVYKLKEIQQRYGLIRPGTCVVDLGCHPGSWLQFCSQIVGPQGRILGIDQKPPTIPLEPPITFLQADVLTLSREQLPDWSREADLVLSDLAPQTSGIKWLDHQRSLDLALRALEIAAWILKPRGEFLVKLFQGEDSLAFHKKMKGFFRQVDTEKPRSSRQESREVYLLGRRFSYQNEHRTSNIEHPTSNE